MKLIHQKRILATVGVVGVIICIVGLVTLHISHVSSRESFIKHLREKTVLREGSMGYQYWRNSPSEEYIDFYVWNIDNPAEVEKGFKPNVTQRGPYTYRVYSSKEQVSSNNGTISYIQTKRYVFDYPKSIGDPKIDIVTTINMPLLNLVNRIQYLPLVVRISYDAFFALKSTKFHLETSAHSLIWGYNSSVVCRAVSLANSIFVESKIDNFSCNFAAFTGVNNSFDGVFTVYDGVDDYHRTNAINTWNEHTSLSIWSNEYGNMINGTDGTYFGQFLEHTPKLFTFESDICRSTYATFVEETTTRGLTTIRYIEPSSVFANRVINPSNVAFCIPDVEHCLPGGLLNVSYCRYGDGALPVVFSLPHFLFADPEVLSKINGVHPDIDLHQTYMDLELNTGLPMNTSRRRQTNAHIRQYNNTDLYKKVREAYIPLVWYQERSVMSQGYADHVSSVITPPLTHGRVVAWGMFGLGLFILFIISSILCVSRCKKTKKKQRGVSYSSIPINYNEENLPLMTEECEL